MNRFPTRKKDEIITFPYVFSGLEFGAVDLESRNLNIRYDLPDSIWQRVTDLYEKLPGWYGYGRDGRGEEGIPYWFSYDKSQKSISASVEPSGLQFTAYNLDREEWEAWLSQFKELATVELGFHVGEIELGEVGYEIEWLEGP